MARTLLSAKCMQSQTPQPRMGDLTQPRAALGIPEGEVEGMQVLGVIGIRFTPRRVPRIPTATGGIFCSIPRCAVRVAGKVEAKELVSRLAPGYRSYCSVERGNPARTKILKRAVVESRRTRAV